MSKKQKKKIEFSKLIVIMSILITILTEAFVCWITVITKDLSALAYLIPAVFTQMGVTISFYLHKAQKENQIKIARIVKEEQLDASVVMDDDF